MKYILSIFVCVLALGVWAFFQVGYWLDAGQEKVDRADLIICLNGPHRVAKAAELFKKGTATEILLTVKPSPTPLSRLGVPKRAIHLAPDPRTTYEEAMAAREFVDTHPVSSAVVVSDAYHLARVKWSFENVFEGMGVRLEFLASKRNWPAATWYQYPRSRYLTASEVSKIVFYWIYHGLLGNKETEEWVFKVKKAYLGWLRRVCG